MRIALRVVTDIEIYATSLHGKTLVGLMFGGIFVRRGFVSTENHRMAKVLLAELICPFWRRVAVFMNVESVVGSGGVPSTERGGL